MDEFPTSPKGYSAHHAKLKVEEHRAGNVLAARGIVKKKLMRSGCASLLPQYLPLPRMPCSSYTTSQNCVPDLVTALARLDIQNHERRSSLKAGSTREQKSGRSVET